MPVEEELENLWNYPVSYFMYRKEANVQENIIQPQQTHRTSRKWAAQNIQLVTPDGQFHNCKSWSFIMVHGQF